MFPNVSFLGAHVLNFLAKFIEDRNGNFAMMLVFLFVPIFGGVAAAVEFSNLTRHQSKLQAAVDAAALFTGKHNLEKSKLPKEADVLSFVRQNFDGPVDGVKVNRVGDSIQVVANAVAPDLFFGSVFPQVFLREAEAYVPAADAGAAEVVLVLDNTYSMTADGKMASLKKVAKDFVADMQAKSLKKGDIKIGLVPFDYHVNVGKHNRNASWMNVPADTSETKNVCRNQRVGGTKTCEQRTRTRDGVTETYNHCSWSGGTMQNVCKNETSTRKWHGCVGSRPAPYTFRDDTPNVKFDGMMNVWCSNPIVPLTDNLASLNTKIDAMTPNRDTYMAPGVMWGTRVLSEIVPFSEGAASATGVRKVMIVMSDGDNVRSNDLANNNSGHWSKNGVQGDTNTRSACTTARNDGVLIFSIAFGNSISTRGQAVLKDCAGPNGGYYLAKDAKALEQAFKDIADKIIRLRLTG